MGFKRFSSGNTDYYRSNYVGANGELTWDDSNGLRLHDGSASGGNPVISVNVDGTITLPTVTSYDGDRNTLLGPTIKMGNDPSVNEVVITGPTPTETYPTARRIVIQGQEGWGPGFGSGTPYGATGGDIDVWAGRGGEGADHAGLGGNVNLRGGPGGPLGGNISLLGGDAYDTDGVGGFLDFHAGNANNGGGIGGNIDVRAGYGSTAGGAVSIHTATSGSTYNNNWTFGNDGTLNLPGKISNTQTRTQIQVTNQGNSNPYDGSGFVSILKSDWPTANQDIKIGDLVSGYAVAGPLFDDGTSWLIPMGDINANSIFDVSYVDITYGVHSTWTFSSNGSITFPSTINAPVGLTKQSFGMGELFAWQDGDTWTIATGDPYTGYLGNTGIAISPGIESMAYLQLPSDFQTNVAAVMLSNVDSMGNVQIGANTHNWTFGYDGNLVLPSGGQILNNDLTPYGTGNIGFVTDFIYDGNGITLENASLSPALSATAAVVVPANGNTSDPLKLQNNIGSVSVVAGTDLGNLKTWSFSTNGGLTFPDATVQKTAYSVLQTTVTLSPSDLAGLNSYPGKTLVSASALGLTSSQFIVVTALEFSLTYNTTPYTTSANLYLNYSGNYLTVAQPIPAGNTTANNNVGLLTSSRNIYRYVQNGITDGDFPVNQDVILMSDGAIANGNSDLRIRVSYIITTLF